MRTPQRGIAIRAAHGRLCHAFDAHNLEGATLTLALLYEATDRVKKTRKDSTATTPSEARHDLAKPPATDDWNAVRRAALKCRACPLWRAATQTVFGEGATNAALVMVGEQPGDKEDLEGRPFVGPAGTLLDRAMEQAGIDRADVYVTNAVKHFKWEPRGKRRLHKKPNSREMAACRPWLAAELRILKPKLLLCLGGTAAATIMGSQVRVLRDRGKVMASSYCEKTMVTVHPSALLRAPDEASRAKAYGEFVRDLKKVARLLRTAEGDK
jgi:uracil-DNA glycosylase family protein